MKSLKNTGEVCADEITDRKTMQKYLKIAFNNLYGEKIDISMIKEDFVNDMKRALRAVLREYRLDINAVKKQNK